MKKKESFIKFLFSLYKPVKFTGFIMITFMIISEIFKLLKQYILKDIIDVPTKLGFELHDLYFYIVLILVFYLFELITYYISNITRCITVYRKQTPYITKVLFEQMNRKRYSFFTDNYSGKITASINQIIDGTNALNERLTTGIISVLTIIVTNLIMLFTINYLLFGVAIVLFLGIIIIRILYFQKTYLPLARKSQEASREFDGILNDTVINFTSIKIFNAIKKFGNSIKSKKEESNEFIIKAHRYEFTFGAIVNVIFLAVFSVLIWYSVKQYEVGAMSIGDLVFFCNAMIALKSASTNFSWAYINTSELLVKLKSGYDILYEGEEESLDESKPDLKIDNGEIVFEHVSFSYTDKIVLKNLSLKIQNRQKIGLIGESGSGKTTISNLIFKFFEPQEGKILIGGKDIQNFNTKSLYENITYIQQETILLHTTILENIKLVKSEATMEEVIDAAKRAKIHDFIMTLNDKYETVVGERGIKLSGGQRQRIALARIFLRQAKVVVFDEATSSLDSNTEFEIQKNINEYFKDQTVLCIAHRLSTLENMDLIYVLKNGEIVDCGKPNEIIPKYQTHKTIFNSGLLE